MNKFTKASIATGAGIVLLLGGAGTLAYWNADATLSGAEITAGTLTITSTAAGQWRDVSADVPSNPKVITTGTFLVVPGDTLEYTENFTVGATGNNLRALVTSNPADIVKGDWGTNLTTTVSFDLYDSTNTTLQASNVTAVTSADNGKVIRVKVTLAFSTAAVDDTQTDVVELEDLAITLTQTRTGL